MSRLQVAHGVLRQTGGQWELQGTVSDLRATVPESILQMIAQQLAGLSVQEQHVLEAASVAGTEFSAASVAAGMEAEVDTVEEWCEGLVHRHLFLRSTGVAEWPDATVAARYGFLHALHQQVVYERVPAGRRSGLHRRIGAREETAYGGRAGEIAAELAVHFERGRDYRRAAQYLQHAGENAVQRSAHQEAIGHLTKGVELLTLLPDTPERSQRELTLQIALGNALIATKGYIAPEVEQAYTRARALCQQLGETPQLFPVLWGLWAFYFNREEVQTARELAEQFLRLAQDAQDSALLVEAYSMLGLTLFVPGELAPALAHTEQGIALYDAAKHGSLAVFYGEDPGVLCLCYGAAAQGYLGYPDRALKRIEAALTLAQELAHPHSLANALYWAAMLHQLRREGPGVQGRAEALLVLSTEHGFPVWLALGTLLQGWALAVQGQGEEGIAQLRQGLDALRAMGSELSQSYFLALLVEAYGQGGQAAEGLTVLAEALATVEKTGERYHEAELYRLKGELTLQKFQVPGSKFQGQTRQKTRSKGQKSKITSPQPLTSNTQLEAEACFLKAIDIARRQSAKSLELRAVMSLSRLLRQQGKKKKARQLLAEIYGWFTEGFDTADLQEAKALLAELTA